MKAHEAQAILAEAALARARMLLERGPHSYDAALEALYEAVEYVRHAMSEFGRT